MEASIICVGNRHLASDDAGPRVFDALAAAPLPRNVEIVDGGLGGIDLLWLVEGRRRVVFADCVSGFARPGEVVVLRRERAARNAAGGYGHGAGLAYLLHMLPAVCEGSMPEVLLVGVEGCADVRAIGQMAALCRSIAAHGVRWVQEGRAQCRAAPGRVAP